MCSFLVFIVKKNRHFKTFELNSNIEHTFIKHTRSQAANQFMLQQPIRQIQLYLVEFLP